MSWIPDNIPLLIDDYENTPTDSIVSVDLETNGRDLNDPEFRIVCIGISDGNSCWVYFDIRPDLIGYLKKARWIVQSGIHAELPWLNKLYGGFSPNNIYFDTAIAAYVHNSASKSYGLKAMVKEVFGVEYPSYLELTEGKEYIEAACLVNPSLLIQRKKGPVLPKKLTLDQLQPYTVAQYNAADTYWTYRLWQHLRQTQTTAEKTFFDQIEMPTTRLIYHMENKGMKIDGAEIRRIHNETSKARRKAKKTLYSLAGQSFNPNSPKQLLPVLKMLGVDVTSTGEDILQRFQDTTPFVRTLLEYRGLQKICSTYTIPLYFNSIKDPHNRIRARFGQNTLTGRLSSSDPINFQNQPPSVRSGFVAEEGSLLLDADWSNLELYLPAHFSGEPSWISELSKPGGDLHMVTAERLFGASVRSLPDAARKAQRATAKEALLTFTNSGTYFSLSDTLNCSKKEAQEIMKATEAAYPEYMKWLRQTKEQARKEGGISTYFGRWVPFPQLSLWCGDPNCEKRDEYCKPCYIRREAEREAISVKVQGTGSDLIKMVSLRLYKEEGYVPNILIHDEYLLEVPEVQIEEVKSKVKRVMENIWIFTPKLRAEIKIAKNWRDAH